MASLAHARRGTRSLRIEVRRNEPRLGLQLRLGLADALQPTLLVGHPVWRLVAPPVRAMLDILGLVRRIGLREPSGDLRRQLRFGRLHPPVAHRLVTVGVGLQLGSVRRHMAQLHQPRRLAQPQHLHEQVGQGRQMPLAEVADGAEVRPVQARHRHHVHPLLVGPRQTPGREMPRL